MQVGQQDVRSQANSFLAGRAAFEETMKRLSFEHLFERSGSAIQVVIQMPD
jgi:hypothetical protein